MARAVSPARHFLLRRHANFVFFDAGPQHGDVTAALDTQRIAIKQPYSALPTWLRISIGLPDDNALVHQIVADSLR
jgi:histidinol-phosphate aminotransferase